MFWYKGYNDGISAVNEQIIMNKICTVFLICGLSKICKAQDFSVKGRVIDDQNTPVQFVSIKLLGIAKSVKQQSATDVLGYFQIKSGQGIYTIKIEQFGKTLYEKPLELYKDLDLSTIRVDNTNHLETVVVEKRENLLERKVDRLVFNVDKSTAAIGGNALDALSITPLVKVDESGGIGIVGKGGVSVMVNERIVHMSGTELTNYLRSLRSDDISKIEVLTTPPAKYESQGNSGMINIQLKRNMRSGWDGYLSSRLLQNTYTGTAQFFGLNYGNEKIITSLKANYYNDRSRADENFQNVGPFSSYSSARRKDVYKGIGVNFGLDYQMNKKSNIGFIYNFGRNLNAKYINETNRYLAGDVVTNLMSTESSHDGKTPSHTINGYYDIMLGESGDKLSFSTNFYQREPKNGVVFYTTDQKTDSIFDVVNDSQVKYRIWSSQGDIVLTRSFAKLEMGVKYTTFKNHSSVDYFNRVGDDLFLDSSRSNRFDYSEKNYATYVSASRSFGEMWSFQLGLRYEYSRVSGLSLSTGAENRSDYGRLFPNAFVNFKPNADNSFTLSYSRRINRPGFSELDPFRWYSTPNSYSTGNPQLRPSYNHNFELSYLLKGKFSSNIYYQHMYDGYKQLTMLKKIDLVSTYDNFFDQDAYGLNITYADKLFPWWETNNAVDLSYSSSKVYSDEMLAQSGTGASFSSNNTLTLNKNKTTFLTANYWMNLPSRRGNSVSKGRGAFQTGTKSYFLDKKVIVMATVNDVFRQLKGRGTNYFRDNVQRYDNYYDSRNITVSVMYRFGKKVSKKSIKNIDFKEVNRAN